ncbi:hypothetical protein EF901_17370, partial [Staphylococcus aureus]
MDINTAVLTFQVRKQDYPLEISKVNTDIYAYFVSDNGSSTGRVQVDYVNPMQGITDENIGFYNMDINTAVLTFQVRKQDYPLEISKVNTDIYAYFV